MQGFLALISFVSYLFAATTGATGPYTTKYEIGPGRIMRDFSITGLQSTFDYKVVDLPILAYAIASGSLTINTTGPTGKNGTKYASVCIPNPLKATGAGSGRTVLNRSGATILFGLYKNVSNPASVGGDVGFVKGCRSGTGDTIFDNLSTASGARVVYTPTAGSELTWQSADYIKLGLRGNPTAAFRAKLYFLITDLGGTTRR